MTNLLNLLVFLKKYFPLLTLVTVILLIYLLKQEKQKVNDYKEVYRAQQKQIVTWRDKAGNSRARAEIAEIKASNARLVLKEDLKRTIEQEVGNLRRNLISYSSLRASTSGSFQTRAIDTVHQFSTLEPLPAKKFVLDNPDLKFNGLYIPALDTLMVDYKVIHNFDIFYYYKRPGKAPFNLFRRKRAVAEIKFDNPGSKADSLFTIVLERKQGIFKKGFE